MTAIPGAYAPPATAPLARGMAFIGYALLFLGLPTLGTSALLGLIMAYARRDGSSPMIASHHRFQIRIFWIGLALGAAALALGATSVFHAAFTPPPAPVHVRVSPHATVAAAQPRMILASWSADEPPLVAQNDLDGDPPHFTYHFRGQALRWQTRALLEGYAAGVLGVFAVFWAFAAPLYGAARLASGRSMGQSAE